MEARTGIRLGVAISTHGRSETFKKSYNEWVMMSPKGTVIVVVDDASPTPVPEATYRFNENQGIATTKNKCLELLDNAGCEHFILSDDDTYPISENWWVPYVESKEPHLMYIFKDFIKPRLNDTSVVYKDEKIVAYSHPRGCMLYFDKKCIRAVGGMDPVFGKWGYEHGDLSNRIYNAGLTSFRYMDVPDSGKLFYASDEHETVVSTCIGNARQAQIMRNKPVAESRVYSDAYLAYKQDKPKRDIVITCFFNGIVDPQRGAKWHEDLDHVLTALRSSVLGNGVDLIVLNDCVEHQISGGHSTGAKVEYVNVETSINPYFQRWASIMMYLKANWDSIGKVFCVDATDVEMLRNPFPDMDAGFIYCGDEEEKLNCEWMVRHHRAKELQHFMSKWRDIKLLNAGLLGGDIADVISVCSDIIDKYTLLVEAARHGDHGPGMTDMAVFNLVLRTRVNNVVHGETVNTQFKANERNDISWFKHK